MKTKEITHKFLVIQTASIGDVVLATSLLEKLHACFPDSPIDLMMKKGCEDLFTGHPFIRQVIIWDKKQKKYRRLFSIMRSIRTEKYSHVIDIHRFAASGFLTAFSKAPNKYGFSQNPFSPFFSKKVRHIISWDGQMHETERNQQLIQSFAAGSAGKVRLYPQSEDIEKISHLTGTPFITISPMSLWFTKQFPAEKWKDFLMKVPPEINIYILGSLAERDIIEREIMIERGGIKNLAGELSLLQTAALMGYAKMNFTNDSAPMHLASAVDAPTAAIFCSTVPAFGFGPLSSKASVIESGVELACRPCGIHGKKSCPEKHMRCGYEIETSTLLKQLEK